MPLLCVISYFSSQIFIYNLQVWNFPKNSSRKSQWYLEKIQWMVSEDELFWEKIPWPKSKVSTISWKNSMKGVGRRAIRKNSSVGRRAIWKNSRVGRRAIWKNSGVGRRAVWKNFGVVDELFEKIPVSEDELFEKIPVSEDELFEKIPWT